MDRRNFFKSVIGGITFTLAAKNMFPAITDGVIPKTIAPATTDLGKALAQDLLSPGFYKVRITDIIPRESRKDGSPYFDIVMQTEDKHTLHSLVSPKAPMELLNMVEQAKVQMVHDSVCLDELRDKEINVRVDTITFKDRNMNRVYVPPTRILGTE